MLRTRLGLRNMEKLPHLICILECVFFKLASQCDGSKVDLLAGQQTELQLFKSSCGTPPS